MKTKNIASFKTYVMGFGLSLALTLLAYGVAQHHLNTGHVFPSDRVMPLILLTLAVVQLFVQLIFFLHLASESKPRWRGAVAVFALVMLLVVVAGSVWIMDNLNYRMTPTQINNYLKSQDGGI